MQSFHCWKSCQSACVGPRQSHHQHAWYTVHDAEEWTPRLLIPSSSYQSPIPVRPGTDPRKQWHNCRDSSWNPKWCDWWCLPRLLGCHTICTERAFHTSSRPQLVLAWLSLWLKVVDYGSGVTRLGWWTSGPRSWSFLCCLVRINTYLFILRGLERHDRVVFAQGLIEVAN